MSLYSEGEICSGCTFAIWFDCGNCLKRCAINREDQRDGITGTCPGHSDPARRERKQLRAALRKPGAKESK